MNEIVIVTQSLGVDGPERVITELSTEWVRSGLKVLVILTDSDLHKHKYQQDNAVEIVSIKRKSNRLLRILNEISVIVRELRGRPDAVALAFMYEPSFALALSSVFVRNKIVLSERSNPYVSPFTKIQRFMRDIAFRFADYCVFQTEDAQLYFSEKIRRKSAVIPNPVHRDLPVQHIGVRRKVFVAACRLVKLKNLPMMIRAFSRFVDEFCDYSLEIYGDGPERPMLEELIEGIGESDKIFLKGYSDCVHQEMVDAAAFISTSDFEGMSNSMLEAMALGLPVIITDCPIGGARAVITHEDNGLLIPVGDEEALYSAMRRLVTEDQLSKRISNEAYKVRADFALPVIAKQWLQVFISM